MVNVYLVMMTRIDTDQKMEVNMFVVKWEDSWLADFGFSNSEESRTFVRSSAKEFKTEKAAQKRINRIRKFRRCENVEILPINDSGIKEYGTIKATNNK